MESQSPPSGILPAGHFFPYELVLNNAIVGLSYMFERRFLWSNGRMAEIFGYRDGELTGQDVRILYATDDDYAEVGQLFRSLGRDRYCTHERAMVKKGGELIWCLISGRQVMAGNPDSPSVWVVLDISDRKQAEDRLRRANATLEQTVERRTLNLGRANLSLQAEIERRRAAQMASAESREKYRTLFRNLPLGVLVTGGGGALVEANRTLQTALGVRGLAELSRVANDPGRVVEKGAETTSLARLLDRHSSGSVQRFEFSWVNNAGALREFTASVVSLSGVVSGTIFTFNDVTDQRRTEAREHQQRSVLAHASRMSLMGQMASALAHELGQPLNSCQSYLAGLKLRLPKEVATLPEVEYALEKLGGQLHRAGEVIRNVRSFMSRQPPEVETLDAVDLVKQTLTLMDPQFRQAKIFPVVKVTTPDLLVRCQAVAIQQVLVNLFLNAIDAMADTPPPLREIEIRIAPASGAKIAFEVIDAGHGVADDVADHLFDPYFTTKPEGLGMGLMICQNLVEAHGGTIRHGRGKTGRTCFRFTLGAGKV